MESYINENQIISHILPNIFIGNYLAVDNEIIDMYDISGIIIAASGIKSNSIKLCKPLKISGCNSLI